MSQCDHFLLDCLLAVTSYFVCECKFLLINNSHTNNIFKLLHKLNIVKVINAGLQHLLFPQVTMSNLDTISHKRPI